MNKDYIVLINTLTPKAGKFQELLQLQKQAMEKFAGQIPGWLGSRLHQAVNEDKIVMTTLFDSIEGHQEWMQNESFARHRERVVALTEKVEPGYFRVAAEAGSIQGKTAN